MKDEFREITQDDVGVSVFGAFRRQWAVADFIGQITSLDVGKRVFLRDGVLQVENHEQLAKRILREPPKPAPEACPMKIEAHEYSGFLRVNVQTRRDGNSSGKVAVDEDTEVYFGGLEAKVTLKDLRIEVTMNPDVGEWRNLEWARRRALEVALAPEIVSEVIVAMCALNRSVGKKEGREELQDQLSKLLGYRR